MRNNLPGNLYLKIRIAKVYADLQRLQELYYDDHDEYLCQVPILYSTLQSLVDLSNRSHPAEPLHHSLLTQISYDIQQNDTTAIHNLFSHIQSLLDHLYQRSRHSSNFSKKKRYITGIAGTVVAVLVMLVLAGTLKKQYARENEEYDLLVNEQAYKEKTLQDIFLLKDALQNYFSDNKSYPKSSGGWDAVIAAFGESKKDWIPGLAPKYIRQLPADPRKSADPMKQYMYKSDGIDFKLIAHFPLGVGEIINNHPELVDSIRPSWAIGVWSSNAKGW